MRYLLTYLLASGDIIGSQVVPYGIDPDAPSGCGIICAPSQYQWERAVRVSNGQLELVSDPVREDPQKHEEPRSVILQRHGLYRANRREAYDPLPEQLDRITKALAYLQDHGIDIGDHGREQVAHCLAVKNEFPVA